MNIKRQPSDKDSTWKFTEKNGKLVRNAKARSIDQYQYGKVILIKKFISFTKEYAKNRPKTIIQENNTSVHAHAAQVEIYEIFDI